MVHEFSTAEKFLYKVSLSSRSIVRAGFELEKYLFLKDVMISRTRRGNHLFVSGLARSGSTILMRIIFSSKDFASLTYRNMPFVLSPNIWSRMPGRGRGELELRERAHGDGILENADSPEAMEEVFWRSIDKNEKTLSEEHYSKSQLYDFLSFIALVNESCGMGRYLSKNNGNIRRLASILEVFPNCSVLIPIRQPSAQSLSLQQQHLLFSKLHDHDKFSSNYMRWLGHYEFGANHKPFELDRGKKRANFDKESPMYWLQQWVSVYSYLSAQYIGNPRVMFVPYERFCADEVFRRKVADFANVKFETSPTELNISRNQDFPLDSSALQTEADRLYDKICNV